MVKINSFRLLINDYWLQFSQKVVDGSERKFAVTGSKILPWCQNSLDAHLILLGGAFPRPAQTALLFGTKQMQFDFGQYEQNMRVNFRKNFTALSSWPFELLASHATHTRFPIAWISSELTEALKSGTIIFTFWFPSTGRTIGISPRTKTRNWKVDCHRCQMPSASWPDLPFSMGRNEIPALPEGIRKALPFPPHRCR